MEKTQTEEYVSDNEADLGETEVLYNRLACLHWDSLHKKDKK